MDRGDTSIDTADAPVPPVAGSSAALATDLVLRVAPDGRIGAAAVHGEHLGWEADQLVGRSILDLLHPDSRGTADDAIGEVLATGRHTRVMQVRTSAGTYRWMSMTVALLRDADGRAVGSIGVGTDVEELVERIRLLEQSEHRYRLLADGSADGVALGRDGVIEWVAGPTEQLMGWTPSELAGQRFLSLVHPDDRAGVVQMLPAIDAGESRAHEVRVRTKSGQYRWYSFRTDPVRDADGAVVARVSRWRDVQVTKEEHDREAVTARRLPVALDSERAVVFEMGGDAGIRWASASVTDLLGFAPAELVGRSVLDLVLADDRERVMNAHARRSAAGLSHVDEVRVRAADGTPRWVSATTVEVTDDRGMTIGFVGLLHDVHDRVAARRQLAVSEERMRLAMHSAPIGMAVVGLDRRFRTVNPALCRLLGREEQWLLGRSIADVLAADDAAIDLRYCADLLSARSDTVTWDHGVVRPDGAAAWVEHSTAVIRDPDGVATEYVVQIVDVTETRRTHDALHFQATHDALTRVGNRRVLEGRIGALLAHEARDGREGVLGAVLFVDVDRLKEINDRFGHGAGDEVLVRVAERISRQVRADDVVGRFGGDEFAVVLPGMESLANAIRVADKILGAMTEPVVSDGVPIPVTVSIGVTLARAGDDTAGVMRRADDALYRAKRSGRGTAAADGTTA